VSGLDKGIAINPRVPGESSALVGTVTISFHGFALVMTFASRFTSFYSQSPLFPGISLNSPIGSLRFAWFLLSPSCELVSPKYATFYVY